MNIDKDTIRAKYSQEYQEGFSAYKNNEKNINPYLAETHKTEKMLAWAYGVEDARGHFLFRISRWLFFHGVPITTTILLLVSLKLGNELEGFFKVVLEAWSFLTLNTGVLVGASLGFVLFLAPAYILWYLLLWVIGIKYRTWI